MSCKFIFHAFWLLVSFFLVGGVAKRRNGTVGRIGYRSSADSKGQVRRQLQSCQKNIGQENLNSVLARCADHYPDVDEQFNKLVEELESTPLGERV